MFGVNLVFMVALAAPAAAADASAWDGGQRASVRLVGGMVQMSSAGKIYRAGVEIRLADGWKTYWRYPGDAGIPPRFDFSRSTNVKSVNVRWPAPHRFTDDSGTSIGYKHGVIFPLEVVPEDATKPVGLALNIDYAVCEKLCVPADGKAELKLYGKSGEQNERIKASEATVPLPAKLGADDALSVRAARRKPGDKPRVVVDVAVPQGRTVELFAEGPAADWALPVPMPIEGAPPGQQRFIFEIDGVPPGSSADGATLTLTATAGGQAIEVPYRLD